MREVSTGNPTADDRLPSAVERAFVIACSTMTAVLLVAIAAMLLAAFAFANERTVAIPLVASFVGFRDAGGSSAVAVTGSWPAAGVVALLLALPMWVVALRHRGSAEEGEGI